MWITIWDSDPDTGPPRYVTVESLHVTGRGSISLIGEAFAQKRHPLDSMRRQGFGDTSSPEAVQRSHAGPRTERKTCDCGNLATPGRDTCSTCRAARPKRPVCACGRMMSAGAVRCVSCVTVDRRIRQRRLWSAQA